jgi:hypothetical protein
MNAVIVVFKSELAEKNSVIPELKRLCKEVTEVTSAYIYSPYSGKLFDFLDILKSHKIGYGTHFDTKAEIH